jgi:predicted phosphodiesterase
MRVAVMSDIHGFDLALERVLRDIERRGPFAEIIVAGDLCEVGPAPARVLDRLDVDGYTLLLGNTDRDLAQAADGGDSSPEAAFAVEQIGDAGVRLLARLPRERRITPPGGESPRDDLLVVHANPHDLETKLSPEMSDDELRDVLGDVDAAAIAFGHHHVSFVRELDEKLLVDVSAVGNPKDGDLRCRYGILTWDSDGRRWTAEIVKLAYPVEETVAEMRTSGMPDPERAIERLLQASYG